MATKEEEEQEYRENAVHGLRLLTGDKDPSTYTIRLEWEDGVELTIDQICDEILRGTELGEKFREKMAEVDPES